MSLCPLRLTFALAFAMLIAVPALPDCDAVREGQYFGDFPDMQMIIVTCWMVRYDENTAIVNSLGEPISLSDISQFDDVRATGCELPDFSLQADEIRVLTAPPISCTTEFPGILFFADIPNGLLNVTCWSVSFDETTVFEDSVGNPIDPADIPLMDEVTVIGCLNPDFTITASKVIWNTSGASGLPSSSDVQVVLNTTAETSWFIQTTTDPTVGPTGAGNANPTLTLEIGMRYMFSYANPALHPFTLISQGASPAADTTLLVQGAGSGSFESDIDVDWVDSGPDIFFTLTPALAAAMEANDGPGYRCNIHTIMMRGDVTLSAASSVGDWRVYD